MSCDIYFNAVNVTKNLEITLFYYCSVLKNVTFSFHQFQMVQTLIHCDPKTTLSESDMLQKTILDLFHHL